MTIENILPQRHQSTKRDSLINKTSWSYQALGAEDCNCWFCNCKDATCAVSACTVPCSAWIVHKCALFWLVRDRIVSCILLFSTCMFWSAFCNSSFVVTCEVAMSAVATNCTSAGVAESEHKTQLRCYGWLWKCNKERGKVFLPNGAIVLEGCGEAVGYSGTDHEDSGDDKDTQKVNKRAFTILCTAK